MKFNWDGLPLFWLCVFSPSCLAFDWTVTPNLDVVERYTDNLRLQSTSHRGNQITTVSPSLTLGYIDDADDLQTKLDFNQLIYHDQPDLDFSEKLANLNYKRIGERWLANLNLSYGEQATLSGQSLQLGVNGSGQVAIQIPRITQTIAPAFTYVLSEKNRLQLGASYTDVKFGSHPFLGLGFSNYTSKQVYSTLSHAYSERLSFNLTTSYSMYQSTNRIDSDFVFVCTLPLGSFRCSLPGTEAYSQDSGTTSIQIGADYEFLEKWLLSVSTGIRDSNNNSTVIISPSNTSLASSQGGPQSSSTNGKIYSASLSKSFEKAKINLSANQQLNPASTGTQQQTSSLVASASYQLDERWSTNVNGSYLVADAVYAGATNNSSSSLMAFNRTLTTLSSSLSWKWTPDINLQLSYTYMDQNYVLYHQTAIANNVELQFIYQPSINRLVK